MKQQPDHEHAEYRATVRLPRTDFPMKANLPQLEGRLLARWKEQKLHARILERNAGRPLFVLHDGPPYANGSIHHGHVLNKVLKDVVVRYRNMAGWMAHLVPGWDCHGLPIELNVDRALTAVEKETLGRPDIRARCRAEAEHWIAVQRAQFERLGVCASWDNPYLTMDPAYEAAVVRELAAFAQDGSLYRGVKPVHWCWSCQTALAEAEVEHRLTHSPSAYITFDVADEHVRERLNPVLRDATVALLVWTTTPWTLPANRAVAVGKASFAYHAYLFGQGARRVVVAAPLKAAVEAALGLTLSDGVAVDLQAVLQAGTVAHPLLGDGDGKPMRVPLVLGDHVTLDQGTGLVHTAPGHGPQDHELGRRLGLDLSCPVGPDGRYLAAAGVELLTGTHVLRGKEGAPSGNAMVLDMLRAKGAVLGPVDAQVEHEYPHCWRCKNPVIYRATQQWFISMEKTGLRTKALNALEQVRWVPAWGSQRIRGMLAARPDWCISRQRVWGVPIPAFVCEGCGEPHASKASFEHVAAIFAQHGSDVWWTRSAAELVPPGLSCGACGGTSFAKEQDIVDVWFESGASFAAVCEDVKHANLRIPADLYLEGSDQHRGWFHSTLLIGVGGRGVLPYKTVLTHGFVVDGTGHKYSKSGSNYVPPEALIEEHGAEVMRMWVAATDYTGDIRTSDEILARLTEGYRKFRNTLRFMLGNLHPDDFNPRLQLVPRPSLATLDRYILACFSQVISRVHKAYEDYQFHLVVQALNEFVSTELSSFYLDVQKDTLYCDLANHPRRRSAQTALYHMCRGLVSLAAPILAFTAEEVWEVLPDDGTKETSVHLSVMPMPMDGYDRDDSESTMDTYGRLLRVRGDVQKVLERFRAGGRPSQGAHVILSCPFELRDFLLGFQEDLPGLLLVSQVDLVEQVRDVGFEDAATVTGLRIKVQEASDPRCARCWLHAQGVGSHPRHPKLCPRCADVVARDGTAA
jgi:isoleucyl-tRNA synthetase